MLKEKWVEFKTANPKVRIRDAARELHTTEAEILAAYAGSSVLALRSEFQELVERLPVLGRIMVLTRNESCVHERKGIFEPLVRHGKAMGVVVGADIDLRLFFRNWAFAFAVLADEAAGFKDSIQVFDFQGTAVMKVFLTEDSDRAAFEGIVRDFAAPVQPAGLDILPASPPPVYKDDQVDIPAFRSDWGQLKDTHDFFPMLVKHQVSRLHALRIAGEFARRVDNNVVVQLLERASEGSWEIMVFVANHGNIQIHTGPVKRILAIPGWINVMDPDFNLHLRLDHICETWMVRKPTVDGDVHSLEVFDAAGELIVQFFGKRKPGQPEGLFWRDWIRSL
ncbi:MAG: hemin-degrading factor [Bacteroidetes bacterium]|nr:hemin-degrading factor [Bacteroidota bacterium]